MYSIKVLSLQTCQEYSEWEQKEMDKRVGTKKERECKQKRIASKKQVKYVYILKKKYILLLLLLVLRNI